MTNLAAQFPTFARWIARLRRDAAAVWRWWSGEIAVLAPGLARLGGGRVIAVNVDAAGAFAPPSLSAPVELRLPAALALRRTLSLPAVAEPTLRDVLSFEMDRETPFRAADVRFDARVVGRADRRIAVDLLVVPRAPADAAMAQAQASGVNVLRLTVEDPDGGCFDLRRADERPAPRGASRPLMATTAILTAAALAVPPLVNLWRSGELAAAAAAVEADAARALRLRDALEQRDAAATILDVRKAAQPLAVAVLADLAARLPDGVWLDQLRLSRDEARLHGYAPAAAELIPLLEASPILEAARFEASVVQDPTRRRERFQIVARIVRQAP